VAIGGALRGIAQHRDGLAVAEKFAVGEKTPRGDLDERIPPVQCAHGGEQPVGQEIAPGDVEHFVKQDVAEFLVGKRGQGVRGKDDARTEDAAEKR
jgi:hypothetical protein